MTHTISLSKMYNPDDFYNELEKHVKLPLYFGRNLDALHDFFTDIPEQTEFIFTETSEAEVMMSKYMKNLKRVCKKAAEENPFFIAEFN
ncbi:MAG: barstar family protein [Lachnospiraceae bacterium]|nr:barstar family protein [Lachnospiraceae bacterium]